MLSLLLVLCSVHLSAETLSVEELKSIQAKFKSNDFLSVDFEQTRFFSSRPNRPVKGSGHADFAKPDKFKWSVSGKNPETWLFNGKTLYQVQEQEKKGIKFAAVGEKTKDLQRVVDLVLNFDSLLKNYRLEKAEKRLDLIELELKPIGNANDLELINIKFDPKQNYVRYLKLLFKNKNSSAFEFSKPLTAKLDEKVFEPAPDVKLSDGM